MDLEEENVSVYMQNFLIKKQIQSQGIFFIPIAVPGGFVGGSAHGSCSVLTLGE